MSGLVGSFVTPTPMQLQRGVPSNAGRHACDVNKRDCDAMMKKTMSKEELVTIGRAIQGSARTLEEQGEYGEAGRQYKKIAALAQVDAPGVDSDDEENDDAATLVEKHKRRFRHHTFGEEDARGNPVNPFRDKPTALYFRAVMTQLEALQTSVFDLKKQLGNLSDKVDAQDGVVQVAAPQVPSSSCSLSPGKSSPPKAVVAVVKQAITEALLGNHFTDVKGQNASADGSETTGDVKKTDMLSFLNSTFPTGIKNQTGVVTVEKFVQLYEGTAAVEVNTLFTNRRTNLTSAAKKTYATKGDRNSTAGASPAPQDLVAVGQKLHIQVVTFFALALKKQSSFKEVSATTDEVVMAGYIATLGVTFRGYALYLLICAVTTDHFNQLGVANLGSTMMLSDPVQAHFYWSIIAVLLVPLAQAGVPFKGLETTPSAEGAESNVTKVKALALAKMVSLEAIIKVNTGELTEQHRKFWFVYNVPEAPAPFTPIA